MLKKALAFYIGKVQVPLTEWCRSRVEIFDDPTIDWTATSIEMRHEWHAEYLAVRRVVALSLCTRALQRLLPRVAASCRAHCVSQTALSRPVLRCAACSRSALPPPALLRLALCCSFALSSRQ